MKLLVIIVNFRTPEVTIDCLRSLVPQLAAIGDARAVVVENGSGDDSAARLAVAIAELGGADHVTLLVEDVNHGFAGGNNRGLAAGPDSDYVLLLNSDTVVHEGTLATVLATMEADESIGALSCRLALPDGTLQTVARRFPTPVRTVLSSFGLPWRWPRLFGWADAEYPGWDRATEARDVDWIGGAFMMLRGDVIRSLGGFDDDFFFYGEDIELCHRIARAGYRRRYDPESAITHLGAASSDPTRLGAAERSAYRWRGRYLVIRKCHGRLAEWLVRGADYVGYSLRLLALRLRGRQREERYHELVEALRFVRRPNRHPAP